MTSELQAFIDYFKDEDELRSAIEGLLSKRGECSGIRNLHGRDEAGKDLIFYAPAGLGGLRLNACVVKLHKITGSASDAKSGARNVLIQCDQALDTPVLDAQGREAWVDHVYVMSPSELSPTTTDSISGRFKGKPSQIEFLCGQDFLRLFKQLWPDFIFFQPDLLSAHLESLGRELESDSNIHRFAAAHGLSAITQIRNIYVEPLLCQAKGRLSRGSSLPDDSFFGSVEQMRDIERINNAIDKLIASLAAVDYLPESFREGRPGAMTKLSSWRSRFIKQWSDAFNRARTEAFAQRRPTPRNVPLPRSVVDAFMTSEGYRYAAGVYSELDREIAVANSCVADASDRITLLGSTEFATYGALVHATTDCFPTLQFECDGRIEWHPEEALASGPNLLITAAPGFGKTSFCRNHFLADLERFKSGVSSVLPLYFAAHSIAPGDSQTFEDIFIRPEVACRLARDRSLSVRIYLDGLDEIRSADLRDQILALVKNACDTASSRYRCLATARDHVGGYLTKWMVRVSLSPMSQENLRDLVVAWLDGNTELISSFYSELSGAESLIPVLGVPLLATLTVLVFKNLRRLPENKLRLYQMFIDLLLGGWNLAKGLQRVSQFSSTAKLLILSRLAGMMHSRKVKECDLSHLDSVVRQSAPSLLGELQSVLGELVEDGLLLPTGRSTYIFPHLSFQEYLAARDAIDPAREEERRIVQQFLSGDDWFKEVASFIVSMTTQPLRMRKWIVELVRPLAGSQGISDAERRAAHLIERISDMFPECKPAATAGRTSGGRAL